MAKTNSFQKHPQPSDNSVSQKNSLLFDGGFYVKLIILGIFILFIFIFGGRLISGYNRVISMDENVKNKWAQVENQLKRRYDLIPNLVETVSLQRIFEISTPKKLHILHVISKHPPKFVFSNIRGKLTSSASAPSLNHLQISSENQRVNFSRLKFQSDH